MNGREVVKAIMQERNMGNAELASKLRITPAALWDRLNNRRVKTDLSATLLSDMLRLMDYKVVAVPRTSRVPAGGFEIE